MFLDIFVRCRAFVLVFAPVAIGIGRGSYRIAVRTPKSRRFHIVGGEFDARWQRGVPGGEKFGEVPYGCGSAR